MSDAHASAHTARRASANPARRASPHSARRAYWLKTLHQWHWISSALCLVGMILFAVTGITLNHAAQIEAKPRIESREGVLPAQLLAALERDDGAAPLPPAVRRWMAETLQIDTGTRPAEWSDSEVYLPLPRPGGDAWLSIDRDSGEVLYERTERGWVSYLNDLHKGRNTGSAWSWFLDIFAGACLLFCLTGLVLLQLHGGQRPATWPVVGLGVLVPLLLALLFIHA